MGGLAPLSDDAVFSVIDRNVVNKNLEEHIYMKSYVVVG